MIYCSAPLRPYSLIGGYPSSVWHDREELHINALEDRQGLETMAENLDGLVGELEAITGLSRTRIALGGFSQGGHMALHCVYGQGPSVQMLGQLDKLSWAYCKMALLDGVVMLFFQL